MIGPTSNSHSSVSQHNQAQQSQSKKRQNNGNIALQILNRSDDGDNAPLTKKRARRGDNQPVIEMLRDDAFPLGIHAKNQHIQELMEEQGEDFFQQIAALEQNEADKASHVVSLKVSQEKKVEEIASEKSDIIASQLFELYQILEKNHYTRQCNGQSILEYTFQLINQLPDKEVDNDLSEKLLEALPENTSPETAKKLEMLLKSAMDTDEDQESDDIQDLHETIVHQIGSLLLLAQHDIHQAAKSVTDVSVEVGTSNITRNVSKILKGASEKVLNHRFLHQSTAIQGVDEATYHKMSLELANLLLLDSGSINIGIIDLALEAVCPVEFANTTAIKNLSIVLNNLEENPLIWQLISRVTKPVGENNPSNLAIRTCFSLDPQQEITTRHAQLFVLSALLGHLRQARAGTCFTTACLIRFLYNHPVNFIDDLAELTKKGSITRSVFHNEKEFPYQTRLSKEYLDTIVTCHKDGRLVKTRRYREGHASQFLWPKSQKGTYLHNNPGIQAACQILGLHSAEESVVNALKELTMPCSIAQVLENIAEQAFKKQEQQRYQIRSHVKITKEQMIERAQYAFGTQTNHPLHRAYEQAGASIVQYFSAEYAMPRWITEGMNESLEGATKGDAISFQKKYKKLKDHVSLAMMSRMRYRYNHHFEEQKKLFDDGNYGVEDEHYYGYELCDSGLPKDFTFMHKLQQEIQEKCSRITILPFTEYNDPTTWKVVNTEEQFRDFLVDVVKETSSTLNSKLDKQEQKEWNLVTNRLVNDVTDPKFTKKMILNFCGRGDRTQKRDYDKNPFNMRTTPWRLMWGGDFNEVLLTFFGWQSMPAKMKGFNGTQKEVLAKCINFAKDQPEQIRETFTDPKVMIPVTSPVHAFLLTPHTDSYVRAWKSEKSTNDYIRDVVEIPGKEIAESRLSIRARNNIINKISSNSWAERCLERCDWERQQLTEKSKEVFDKEIEKKPNLLALTAVEFKKQLWSLTVKCRAADPEIGQRNRPWDQRFDTLLTNKFNELVDEKDYDKRINGNIAQLLIDFARNREDTISLSKDGVRHFEKEMEKVPLGLSNKDFRKKVIKIAYDAHKKDLCGTDPKWKNMMTKNIDNWIYANLSSEDKAKLIKSGVVTHDTNWKAEIHDIYFMFVVNPGSGNIELADYTPDIGDITLRTQDEWFTTNPKREGRWEFPDNYRYWKGEPPVNVKRNITS